MAIVRSYGDEHCIKRGSTVARRVDVAKIAMSDSDRKNGASAQPS